jgi:signal transduction histidine kinase/ligand-binding sensor domain-containing protein
VALAAMGMLFWGNSSHAAEANAPRKADQWVARSWQTEEGLPQNSINALAQTRDGFLWVGTSGGLTRFDGHSFRRFGLQDGLLSVYVMSLAEDKEGALWIGTSGGGVSRWQNGRIKSFGAEDGFPGGLDVIALTPDPDGSVWIGTSKGLMQRNHGNFKAIGEAEGLPRNQVRALAVDSQGALWVSVIMEGLFHGTDGRFSHVQDGVGSPGGVYCLLGDRDGSVWAGSGSGQLWQWRNGAWKRFGPAEGLPEGNVQALSQDKHGVLWAGGQGGIRRFSGERFEIISGSADLSDRNVQVLNTDREGSVWVGLPVNGLFRLSRKVLEYWGRDAGLPDSSVSSVSEDSSGSWWLGTASKGMLKFDGVRFTSLQDPAITGNFPYFYSTAGTGDGCIWAAGEQCLYRFQEGQPTKAFLDPPIKGEAIRALCPVGDTLWMGTYYSAILKCDAQGVQAVAPRGTFPGGITCLVHEAEDTFWVSTSEGLHRWERGHEVKTWNKRDGLLTANVRTVHREADGTLWLGTLGGGMARFKDGRIFNITSRHGLVDDVISQIVADDLGYLWLGSNRGIMRLKRDDLDALADGKVSELHPLVFGKNEGMLHEQCSGGHSPSAIKTRNGRLLFPTIGGLAGIDPREVQNLIAVKPSALMASIQIDGKPQPLDENVVVPPGPHHVQFEFTAPALRGGEWIRFRYQLQGFDEGWVSAGSGRFASYEGLRPGNYVFRVIAAADGAGWGEGGAILPVTVKPAFWQTFWFRFLAGFVVVGLNAGAVWWYSHRKHLKRIAEFESERRQQAELAHSSRVSLLGELSASLSHELKQPLAAILTNAQAAMRFLNDDPADLAEVRDSLRDIAAADRRANEIIERMRSMMKKGEAEMEARDLNADIHQTLLLTHSDLLERDVSVVTRLAPDLPHVNGDHIQLQQVLLNLIINACDAMMECPPDERELTIETAREGAEFIQVSVTDRGSGVAPEMLERVFEPFYSTKKTGLGMGLSICRAIIRAHGGQLWASNHPERGTIFRLTLLVKGDESRGNKEVIGSKP